MVGLPRDTTTPSPEPSAGERLDSWKEIAAHFDRTVRTVQLWEKRERLPVHRHVHNRSSTVYANRSSTVYAYPSELDAWWNNGRVRLEQDGDRADTRRPRWRRLVLAVVVPTLLLMAVLAGWYYRQGLGGVGEDRRGAVADASAIVLRHSPEPHDVMLIGKPSLDGRYLPYADVDGDLAVFEFATEETHRLTNERPADDSYDHAYYSAISPDGEQVAYAWYTYDGKYMDLRVIGMDGSEPRVVYQHDDLAYIEFLDWAPDGEHLLARFDWRDTSDENDESTPNRSEIALVSVANGSTQVLKTLDEGVPRGMSLSPDGRYLVYDFPASDDSRTRDLYLLALESGEETPLVQHAANDVHPFWSSDGTTVVFSSDRAGRLGVWTLPMEEGQPQGPPEMVLKDMGRGSLGLPLGLTRDGALYYYLSVGMSDVFVASLDPVTGTLTDGPAAVSERFMGSSRSSDWSPDGRYLAYSSRRGSVSGASHRVLLVRDMETAEERELSPGLRFRGRPRWSADGGSIFVRATVANEQPGLYKIDVVTGELEAVLPGFFPDLQLTPDETRAFYWKGGTIGVRELATGDERELFGPAVFNLVVSPDGERLAFNQSGALFVMPAEGGEPRELLRSADDEGGQQVQAWTRDGEALFFTKRGDGQRALWRISAEGGEVQEVGLAMQGLREVSVHPDGRRIAFTGGWPYMEVWVMENFLEPVDAAAQAGLTARQ